MEEDPLRAELEQVTVELKAARTQYASLGARIAGLEARQSALARALPADDAGAHTPPPARYRTDAIVGALRQSAAALSIDGVIAALRESGRPGESRGNVGADLAYLTERGRVMRVRRGVYATGVEHRSIQRCPDGHDFFWQPAPGLCPYCVLTSEERIAGLQSKEESSTCPPDCCPVK
jgi:hypothetical protein